MENGAAKIAVDAARDASNGLDAYVLEKIVTALEARMGEHLGQVDRRLAETEAKVALELQALERRRAADIAAVEQGIQELVSTCRVEIEAVGRRNSEQIAGLDQKLLAMRGELPPELHARIDAGMGALETRVQNDFQEAVERTADLISQIMQTTVLPRIVQMEADVRRFEALNALRQMSAPAEPEAPLRRLETASDSPLAAQPAAVPSIRPPSILFAAEEPRRKWIIPLVSCFLTITLGLVLLRFM